MGFWIVPTFGLIWGTLATNRLSAGIFIAVVLVAISLWPRPSAVDDDE